MASPELGAAAVRTAHTRTTDFSLTPSLLRPKPPRKDSGYEYGGGDDINSGDADRGRSRQPRTETYQPAARRLVTEKDILADILANEKNPDKTPPKEAKKLSREDAKKVADTLGPQIETLDKEHTKYVGDKIDAQEEGDHAKVARCEARIKEIEQAKSVGNVTSKTAEKRVMSWFERTMANPVVVGIMGLLNVFMFPLMLWPSVEGLFNKSSSSSQQQGP
jgi:hypothetical protein